MALNPSNKKRWIFLASLFLSMVVYGEDFSTFFLQQARSQSADFAVVCIDSLSLNKKETTCESMVYRMGQKVGENRTYLLQNGKWKVAKKNKGVLLESVEADFSTFLVQFSTNHEMQMYRTIFPLPISYRNKEGIVEKKKQIMPRDWTDLTISQQCIVTYSVQPQKSGNNRKVYIYKNGTCKEFYNFIFINKQWYLIEMEIYQ